MKVWVDCTAAAHPLVLRPIIERLEAAGHEVEVTTRELRADRAGSSSGSGSRTRRSARHGGAARRSARRLALAGRSAAARVAGRGAGGSTWRSRTDRWTSPWSPRLLRVPSVQMNDYEHAGLQRRISFRAARRVLVPDAIPVERIERAGARRERLFRYPGLKEDYYLADFEPDARGPRASSGIDRDAGCSWSCARRPRPRRTTRDEPALRAGARPARRRSPASSPWSSPAPTRQAERRRGRAAASPRWSSPSARSTPRA